jgi:hypothetical protein
MPYREGLMDDVLPPCAEELETIRLKLKSHDVVVGPPELYAAVKILWPELLHKVKPPRKLTH